MHHTQHCTTEDKRCNHDWATINIKLGEYIVFPSSFFHQGYFENDSAKTVVTAQLFASSNGSSSNQPVRYLSSTNTMNDTDHGQLAYDFSSLSKDVLEDWESSYPIATFPPCKYFGGLKINQESNRPIHRSQFASIPYIATLVEYFEAMDKTLSVDQVWLIRKSESEEGFQRWHQDLTKLKGERSIVKTIVVNIGEMMIQETTPLSTNIEAKKPSPEVPSPEVQLVRYDKREREKKNSESQILSRLVMDEAWVYLENHGNPKWRDKTKMFYRIYCDHCSPGGQFGTMVAAESLVHRYVNTQEWYDQGLVEGFIALVQHDAHMAPPSFKDDKEKTIMTMVPAPEQIIDEEFWQCCTMISKRPQ
jgi:hypothetical protein